MRSSDCMRGFAAQAIGSVAGELKGRVWIYAEQEHACQAAVNGDADRVGNLNGRYVRHVARPVDGAHHAKVVIKRNDHACQRGKRETVVGSMPWPCSITDLSRRNFPKNPARGGMPANETIARVIVAAKSGARRFRPAKAEMYSLSTR